MESDQLLSNGALGSHGVNRDNASRNLKKCQGVDQRGQGGNLILLSCNWLSSEAQAVPRRPNIDHMNALNLVLRCAAQSFSVNGNDIPFELPANRLLDPVQRAGLESHGIKTSKDTTERFVVRNTPEVEEASQPVPLGLRECLNLWKGVCPAHHCTQRHDHDSHEAMVQPTVFTLVWKLGEEAHS